MSAIYSALFIPNIYFWLNTGYFDQAAMTMPLLHLWSIGVEEQFYLMWPLALVLSWRFVRLSRPTTLIVLIALTALLVLLCIVWTQHDAKSAFYLPFTRLWEFTLGALALALPAITKRHVANALSVAGILAMVAAVLTFNDGLDYPGHYAILPCLGTAAVIAAGARGLINRVFSLAPMVLLGKMSYSLYLWHWPILVYYGFYAGAAAPVTDKLWLILLALAISFVSWRFVETPARHRKDSPRRHVALGASVAVAATVLAYIVVANAGFPNRLPEDLRALGDQKAMMAFDCTEEIVLPGAERGRRCIVGAPWATASKHAVLWGDSHAKHLLSIVDIPAREQNLSILHWGGCPPFIDNESLQRQKLNNPRYSENCAQSRRALLDWLAKTSGVDLVIISNAWPQFPNALYGDGILDRSKPAKAMELIEDGLRRTLSEITAQRAAVLLMGDVPRPGFFVPDCVLQSSSGLWRKPCPRMRDHFKNSENPTEALVRRVASETDHTYYLDTLTAMCSGPKGCSIRVGKEIIYRDSHHLRHDLSLETRKKIVTMLGLDEALRAAMGETSEVRAEGAAAQIPPPK
jgi:hypothetical protein